MRTHCSISFTPTYNFASKPKLNYCRVNIRHVRTTRPHGNIEAVCRMGNNYHIAPHLWELAVTRRWPKIFNVQNFDLSMQPVKSPQKFAADMQLLVA